MMDPTPAALSTSPLSWPTSSSTATNDTNNSNSSTKMFNDSPALQTNSINNNNSNSSLLTSTKDRSETIDLSDNTSLAVDISDALSERERVKFTVHTKTTLTEFKKHDFSVVRQHEEFIWLHNSLLDNEEYAGYIIPPAPPRPDFEASREKLQRLGEGENTMTKEEFNKMKQELEAEYLATFKKTVAMHEVFLQRLAQHPRFKNDPNFRIFLEYENDLSVRGKNKREKLVGLFANIKSSTDGLVLNTTQKDIDPFFEQERVYLNDYFTNIRTVTTRADAMTKAHKSVADSYIKISFAMGQLANSPEVSPTPEWNKFYIRLGDTLEKLRKTENRVASDEDLKLSDLFRYYMRDTSAAKDLLNRRLRCLANYETTNRNLEKARAKNRDVQGAEKAQTEACTKFENISVLAKQELTDFKKRRVLAFRKYLVELSELEIKHAKSQVQLIRNCISVLNGEINVSNNNNNNNESNLNN